MARLGHRVVLLDADVQCGDVGTVCGIEASHTLADVFESRISLEDALQPGPAGMLVLPGCWAPEPKREFPPLNYRRLMENTVRLGHVTEWVIVDAGAGDPQRLQPLWQLADRVLVAITPDAISILNGYARMKWLIRSGWRATCHTLVNQAAHQQHATEIYHRLAHSCRRFLGFTPDIAGWVPLDLALTATSTPRIPLALREPKSPAALAIDRIGTDVTHTTPVAPRMHHHPVSTPPARDVSTSSK